MTDPTWERPDVARELATLKDFQRNTVRHAFQRLYLDGDSSHRFLVADEVGLGKTMVAKGIIAKAIDHLWDHVDRIDVIYVCSNADIARQNVNRLDVMGRGTYASATRITLLPLQLSGLKKNKVNFVSFTPATSIDIKSGTGLAKERALLYRMLQNTWRFGSGAAPLNVLLATASANRMRYEVSQLEDRKRYPHGIDAELQLNFANALARESVEAQSNGRKSLQARFEALCGVFTREDRRPTREQQSERMKLLGELRHALATTCVRALQPDLVILDEFQRFKDVLTGTDDAAELARELFSYSDDQSAARVLLLSATPYKMYTTKDDVGELDHYGDFIETLRFLQRDQDATNRTSRNLAEMRRAVYRGAEGRQVISELRASIERDLKRVMARTERLAVSADRSGMLKEVPAAGLALRQEDVRSYTALQAIGRELKQPDTVEFWKAAPYLLNFMDKYQVKQRFLDAIEVGDEENEVPSAYKRAVRDGDAITLSLSHIESQEWVDPPHARMRWLMKDVVERGSWRLLWIPPSLPYYGLGGPFAEPAMTGFTKRLIFSAWKVAPKAIATLVSYDAERRMLAGTRKTGESRTEQIDRTRPLLNFTRSGGRLVGLPVLGLLYPSITLAELGDPLLAMKRDDSGAPFSLEEALRSVTFRLEEPLTRLLAESDQSKPVDERWYWAAPILLDRLLHHEAARKWTQRPDLALKWSSEETDDVDGESGWAQHVEEALSLVRLGRYHALGTPPSDLADVLALIAMAGPAVCALRALSRSSDPERFREDVGVRDAAARVAHGFRALFNLPEVISLLRGMNGEEPYWLRVVEYSTAGCLQAVLDEYVHVALGWEGLSGRDPSAAADQVAKTIREALGLRTSRLGLDDITVTRNGRVRIDPATMRARFAMRFGDEASEDESDANRKEAVRTAFNSPFWPFVLASTSVGQEGLDFHLYCHAIVHWNVPSNPVDMEQREGRVHRFKGHAVRRNVATRHGSSLGPNCTSDPWNTLFELACNERQAGASDIVPFWAYPLIGGAAIERHVPNLPLSRDAARYSALRRSLAVYRMVFGQPRQDDLLEYLVSQGAIEGAVSADDLRIDLTP